VLSGCENKRDFVKQTFLIPRNKIFCAFTKKKLNEILSLAIYYEKNSLEIMHRGGEEKMQIEIVNIMLLI
jgi:hypothetical protein